MDFRVNFPRFADAVTETVRRRYSFGNEPYPTPDVPAPPYDLKIVQIDDFGSFWDINKATKTLNDVKDAAASGNVLVVLFVHGWHHNAAEEDSNLKDFGQTLEELSETVNTTERKALRFKVTGSEDLCLIGIYLGWRGRSLPGYLDYATMWPRKSAAERVGDGDASEFIERLDRIYLRSNGYTESSDTTQRRPMMGLVTIGHSFGGQVLLRSIARSMEHALAKRAPNVANVLNPVPQDGQPRLADENPIGSLGDLNILVNPATEAYQFGRIDALYRQLEYPQTQTPQIVIFSADNDIPRKVFFPVARAVTRPIRPNFRSGDHNYQGALWGTALGELAQQKTHDLYITSEKDSLNDADYGGADLGGIIWKFDFTGEVIFGGVKMTPVASGVVGSPGRIPNSPAVVAVTHEKIIDGHNGIFGETFRNFLIGYVAFVEGKRILLRAQKHVELR